MLAEHLDVYADVDVVVVGAGSAGTCAAIAAARSGATTLLVERLPYLGGISTSVLDTFYGFYSPGRVGRRVVRGLADEVLAGLASLGPVIERPNSFGWGTGVTYHPEHLKVVWERLARASRTRLLLYGVLQDATVRDGHVESVVVATKAGLRVVRARVFVDASGDADLCHFASFRYDLAGEHDPAQTLTTTFRMCNVDLARRRTVSKAEVDALMAHAAESGAYRLPRREGSDHATPIDGMTATIMTKLPSYRREGDRVVNATDPDLLTEAELAGREQALEYARFLVDRVPGYEQARLVGFSTGIGVRETRRVVGDYRVTRDDVLAGRRFDDQVALCGTPIEDHREGGDTRWEMIPEDCILGIPYRSLVVADAQNVLVAGRCFSATHDGHAAVRGMAQCMAMGHAAGDAAALAVERGCAARDIPIAELQVRLRREGALLDLEASPKG